MCVWALIVIVVTLPALFAVHVALGVLTVETDVVSETQVFGHGAVWA